MSDQKKKFTCAACGGTFDQGWSDEEAYAESRDVFGMDPASDPTMAVVCDVCYRQMVPPGSLALKEPE